MVAIGAGLGSEEVGGGDLSPAPGRAAGVRGGTKARRELGSVRQMGRHKPRTSGPRPYGEGMRAEGLVQAY